MSQLDNAENPNSVFDISEESFPFDVHLPTKKKYTINEWGDIAGILANAPNGRTPMQHARDLRVKVGNKWKSISLQSIAQNELTALYMVYYSRAKADYIKGYLFSGDLSCQPNLLYGEGQAFDIISGAISEAEIENLRTIKKTANNGRE